MAPLPETMTAMVIRAPGGPEMLVAEQRPLPRLGDGEILVKVRAAGVNRPDIMQRRGQYPPPPGAPADIPGLEVAGEVAALGHGVTRFALGDAVCALLPGGGYAEFAKVHESNALPAPKRLSISEAAAVPETFFTIWPSIMERGQLSLGDTILIHGGTSGIGTSAIQLARVAGARVITTSGSDEKCQACRELGADVAINYKTEDFVEVVKRVTEGAGANVILDMVGGDYVNRNYEAAAVEARIVQIAVQRGAKAEVDVRRLMMKRLWHTGSTLRPQSIAFKARIASTLHEKLWPLFEARKITPIIGSTYPLARAADAHFRMDAGDHIGRIVLTVTED
ncbi:NAD(P)H-quinone oxidoreductase [Bauldia litoralis]|uniref:Putative NAD(P)H quinone oxidoreductase, PIG3 family n=1 Tax=Bauldia litoralis TaxID=665467 RepID=A0A1G6A2Z5_9HYPH|nr:NAD(P)H-quinone oxidoreductase [Bauldia litoralis]SDB02818.1 putative NAD(P)H quinone oxidoreductase, PIG3 family [Bauldia litoralis]